VASDLDGILPLESSQDMSINITSKLNGNFKFVLLMDKVFDSTNGSTINAICGKPLRCAIKNGSPHIQFWNEAIQVFKSIFFVNKFNETIAV